MDGGFLVRHLTLQRRNVRQEQCMGFGLVGLGRFMIFYCHLQAFPNALAMAM